jgi:phage tail-like protein
LWGGPFKNPSPHPEQWHQLTASVELPTDAHIQFFVYASMDTTAPSEPWNSPVVDLEQEQTQRYLKDGSQDKWLRVPLDVTACLIPGQAFEYVWVAAELSSEGLSTPALEQLRIDFDHQSYVEFLPTIYRAGMQIPERGAAADQDAIDRRAARTRQFLTRFLSLFQSEYADLENVIARLASLFDAAAVPLEFLDWLASWLALELDPSRTEEERRNLLADAFVLYAKRGTVEGLSLALQRFAHVDAQIQEPLQQVSWWALPANESSPPLDAATSVLGFTTMLAPSEPQGAVVGTTAILDASHLIRQEEYGAPLFSEFAHQFSVRLYRGATYSEQKVSQLRALIEREKPAHVLYDLCVVEPQMRVGFQAQLGIDTVVAGAALPTRLGESEIVLGGETPGRIGQASHVGQTTRLNGVTR